MSNADARLALPPLLYACNRQRFILSMGCDPGVRSVKAESANPPLHSSAVRHYVSPRDFLGLIRAFVSLVNEKRAELEDQQVRSLEDMTVGPENR